MDRIEIDTWASISKDNWIEILLGNGASIAIHKEFAYPTLHSVAGAKGFLPTTAPLFAKLGTTDFEHVLLTCWYAEHVNVPWGTASSISLRPMRKYVQHRSNRSSVVLPPVSIEVIVAELGSSS